MFEPPVCVGDSRKSNLEGGVTFGMQSGSPGAERGLGGLSDSAKGCGGWDIVFEPPVCVDDGRKSNSEGGVRFGMQSGPPGAERGLWGLGPMCLYLLCVWERAAGGQREE